jgi:hypothetical protein
MCRACNLTAAARSPAFVGAQDVAPFVNPKIELEQYPTGAHLASRLLFTASRPPSAPQSLPRVLPPLPC